MSPAPRSRRRNSATVLRLHPSRYLPQPTHLFHVSFDEPDTDVVPIPAVRDNHTSHAAVRGRACCFDGIGDSCHHHYVAYHSSGDQLAFAHIDFAVVELLSIGFVEIIRETYRPALAESVITVRIRKRGHRDHHAD